MAILGIFSKLNESSLAGSIRTLTMSVDVMVRPVTGPRDTLAPTHQIIAGEFEIGSAWLKEDQGGKEYFNVKIDDPSFSAPLLGTLQYSIGDGNYALVWNRPGSARHQEAA